MTLCIENLETSSEIFWNILSKYTFFEKIALEQNFENLAKFKQILWEVEDKSEGAKRLVSDIDKMDNLWIDAQQYMFQGNKNYQELKKCLDYDNLSFYRKSRILSALVDSKALYIRTEIRLLDEPYFTGK